MTKTKNKSHLKEITLRSLIIVPLITENAVVSVPVLNYKNMLRKSNAAELFTDFNKLQEKTVEIMDINIKRLEKVRHRIIESSRDGKTQLISKIDNMLKNLKLSKSEGKKLDTVDKLLSLNKEIYNSANKNEINLGHVFDGRRDTKTEKFYSKLTKKFREVEKNIQSFSGQRKDSVIKIIHKGYNLIEQLRNEDKKDKEKAEVRRIRRELANCFNQIKFLM